MSSALEYFPFVYLSFVLLLTKLLLFISTSLLDKHAPFVYKKIRQKETVGNRLIAYYRLIQ